MTLSLGQIIAALTVAGMLVTVGRLWEQHEQRIQVLEREQRFSHGDLAPFMKE